jgi:hypothetical protein
VRRGVLGQRKARKSSIMPLGVCQDPLRPRPATGSPAAAPAAASDPAAAAAAAPAPAPLLGLVLQLEAVSQHPA